MRFTFLTHFPGRGGSTTLLLQLKQFLNDYGHSTTVICSSDAPNPQIGEYKVVPKFPRFTIRRRRAYIQSVIETNPDVVYAISGTEEFDILRFLRLPRAHHISSLENHEFTNIPRLLRRTSRYTELFTANTADVLSYIQNREHKRTSSYALAPYRFDASWFTPSSSSLTISRGPIRICYSGRLEPFQKRTHWLPPIIRQCAQLNLPIEWHIIGSGPLEASLQKELVYFTQPDSKMPVRFHGWRSSDEIRQIFNTSDAFFLCSRWEGLPISMVESMLCGLVPITPKIEGGISFIMSQSDIGYPYIASSPDSCVKAIAKATLSPSELIQKKQASRTLARTLFSHDVTDNQLSNLESKLRSLQYNGKTANIVSTPGLRSTSMWTTLTRKLLSLNCAPATSLNLSRISKTSYFSNSPS